MFSALNTLFDPPKIRQALKTHKFKCDCSELATLAPLIARYLREVVRALRISAGGQSVAPLGWAVCRRGPFGLSPRV